MLFFGKRKKKTKLELRMEAAKRKIEKEEEVLIKSLRDDIKVISEKIIDEYCDYCINNNVLVANVRIDTHNLYVRVIDSGVKIKYSISKFVAERINEYLLRYGLEVSVVEVFIRHTVFSVRKIESEE